jgi:hypothetical protein
VSDFQLVPNWRGLVEDMVDPVLELAGDKIRDRSRQNAKRIDPDDVNAIVSTPVERDDEGHYVDVGYDKHHPGFVLWWHEVGTSQFPPNPHLRPAASGKII